MKIEVLNRDPRDYIRETKRDIHKVHRNLDKKYHPMSEALEYSRAVKFTKLERMFAKPFVSSLDGHKDGVTSIERHPTRLPLLYSASFDGEIKLWNLTYSKCMSTVKAHDGEVKGIGVNSLGTRLISVGIDSLIRSWKIDDCDEISSNPITSIVHSSLILGVSFSNSENIYATCGQGVNIWDISSASSSIAHFSWGIDSVHGIKFNPIETNTLISLGSDRGLTLHDIRKSEPLAKIYLSMKATSLSWHPLEAYTFVAASEDSNLYCFDTRKLMNPVRTYGDHTNAVLDVDFSPTGQEFATASYDKSLRIYPVSQVKSRDVYHTKRMQRIFCVKYSGDSKYVMCGSDEMNIRLWKSNASEKLGYLRPREMASLRYAESLKDRFKHHPEIRKISKKRHLPQSIYNFGKQKKTYLEASDKKRTNMKIFRKEEVPDKNIVLSKEE